MQVLSELSTIPGKPRRVRRAGGSNENRIGFARSVADHRHHRRLPAPLLQHRCCELRQGRDDSRNHPGRPAELLRLEPEDLLHSAEAQPMMTGPEGTSHASRNPSPHFPHPLHHPLPPNPPPPPPPPAQ